MFLYGEDVSTSAASCFRFRFLEQTALGSGDSSRIRLAVDEDGPNASELLETGDCGTAGIVDELDIPAHQLQSVHNQGDLHSAVCTL